MINQPPFLLLFLPAVKNQATGHYILNGKGEGSGSRSFIDLGLEWEYHIEDDIETLQTDGPLYDAIVVLVGHDPFSVSGVTNRACSRPGSISLRDLLTKPTRT